MIKRQRSHAVRRLLAATLGVSIGVVGFGVTPASAGVCTVSASRAYAIEGDADTSPLTFTVSVSGCAFPLTVDYATRDDAAKAGSDYVAISGDLTFPDGTAQTVDVEINGDTTREWTEAFFLDVTATGAVTDTTGGRGEITDEDGASNVLVYDNPAVIDTADGTGAEGDNTQAALAAMGHTVTTSVATDGATLATELEGQDAFVIPEESVGDFATAVDQAALDAVKAFVEGGGTLVKMDDFDTLNSIFGYTLASGSDGDATQLDGAVGTEFANNTDMLLSLNATTAVTAASLPAAATALYGLGVGPTDITALLALEGDGSIVWLGYDWFDSQPGFGVDQNPDGQNDGWSAVLDSAVEKPDIAAGDISVTEGDAATTASVPVTLSDMVSEVVTVEATTAAGTATAGSDYTTASGTITFDRGDLAETFPVTIAGDNLSEPDEALTVALADPRGARVVDASASIMITDDDQLGYRMVAGDGGIFTFGDNLFHGSTGDKTLNSPIVGGATDPVGTEGYWIVAGDGGVFTFGSAVFFGSLGDKATDAPIVEIEPTPTGKGYWLVSAKGRVYAFGDAKLFGDASAITLNQPIIGMSVAPDGAGYWLVAKDGGIFSYGSATFMGSMGDKKLNAPVVDLSPTPDGKGYYLVAQDGGVFTFGSAIFFGSTGSMTLNAPVTALLVAPDGTGYWLGATDGGVFTFGKVLFLGSMGATKLNAPVIDFIP